MAARLIRHVVKRKGRREEYDVRKVYASVYSAALSCHYGEKKSESLASSVLKKVNSWIRSKKMVSSRDIRDEIVNHLKKFDKDVELMYKHHLDVC